MVLQKNKIYYIGERCGREVRSLPFAAYFFWQSRCPEREDAIPHPAFQISTGAPTSKFCQTHKSVPQTVPHRSKKPYSTIHQLMTSIAGPMTNENIYKYINDYRFRNYYDNLNTKFDKNFKHYFTYSCYVLM